MTVCISVLSSYRFSSTVLYIAIVNAKGHFCRVASSRYRIRSARPRDALNGECGAKTFVAATTQPHRDSGRSRLLLVVYPIIRTEAVRVAPLSHLEAFRTLVGE